MSDVDSQVPNPNPAGAEIDAVSLASHYERDDVNIGAILWFAGGLFVVLVIVHLVLFWVVRGWADRPLLIRAQISPADVTPAAVSGPGLDADPEAELDTLLGGEMGRLDSYGWIDRDGGVVRIPVERAMSLLVEEGLPAREGEAPSFALEPAFRLDSSGGLELNSEEAGGEDAGGEQAGDEETPDESSGDESSSDESSSDESSSDEGTTENETADE